MKLLNTAIRLTAATLLLGSPVLLAQQPKDSANTETTADAAADPAKPDEPSADDPFKSKGTGGAAGTYSYGLTTRSPAGPGGARSLIVRTSTPDVKEQSNLEEDMAVMGLILDKALQEDAGSRGGRAMGINVLFAPGAGPMRNLYLDGYGVVFFKRVPFPLMASPAKADNENQETPADSTWESAKQELYGHPGENEVFGQQPGEQFDEEQVSHLKKTLLESLKNATNIRDLKPIESVTICVQGGASAGHTRSTRSARFSSHSSNRGYVTVLGASPAQGTILTLSAKKSDIDAYAKGKLNLEDFTRRVRIVAYAGATDAGSDAVFYSGMGGVGGGGYGSGGSGVWSFGPGR